MSDYNPDNPRDMRNKVCRNCGASLTWMGEGRGKDGWRHSPGPGHRGCPKPSPIDRRVHEKLMEKAIKEAMERL